MFTDTNGSTYSLVSCISTAHGCTTWKAKKQCSGGEATFVVIKELAVQDTDTRFLNCVYHRFFMHHPNVINQEAAFMKSDSGGLEPKGNTILCVVEEYFDRCSLHDLLTCLNKTKTKPLSQAQISSVLFEICCGIRYLHQDVHIAHRSLTTNKIVLNREAGTVKISLIEGDDNIQFPPPTTKEIHPLEHVLYDPMIKAFADDIWCLGVIAVQLVAANAAHGEEVTKQMIDDFSLIACSVEPSLFTTSYVSSTARNFSISSELLDFISCCLRKDLSSRPHIGSVMEHQLFTVGASRDTVSRSKHMDSLMRSIVRRCCVEKERIDAPSSLGCSAHIAAGLSSPQSSFKWVFPSALNGSPKPLKNYFERNERSIRSERERKPVETRQSVKETIVAPVQDRMNTFLEKLADSPAGESLERCSPSTNSVKTEAERKEIESLRYSSINGKDALADVMTQFAKLSEESSEFVTTFCNQFACGLSRGIETLEPLVRTLSLVEELGKSAVVTDGPPRPQQQERNVEYADYASLLNDTEWNKVPRMPSSAGGSVFVPHYLFNKWLREKQADNCD